MTISDGTISIIVWSIALVVVLAGIVLALTPRGARDARVGALGAIPVGLGLLAHAFAIVPPAPHPAFAAVLALALVALGVAAGNPVTRLVLASTPRGEAAPHVEDGDHGGIVTVDGSTKREVLRGGATIGYLERAAIIGCIAVGRFEGIAVVVAIKGLGRFSELDTPEARERFIIGTLVSLLFASATAALIVLSA